jgi:hypothetical protein
MLEFTYFTMAFFAELLERKIYRVDALIIRARLL